MILIIQLVQPPILKAPNQQWILICVTPNITKKFLLSLCKYKFIDNILKNTIANVMILIMDRETVQWMSTQEPWFWTIFKSRRIIYSLASNSHHNFITISMIKMSITWFIKIKSVCMIKKIERTFSTIIAEDYVRITTHWTKFNISAKLRLYLIHLLI